MKMRVKRKGEYGLKGDYHKKLDKNLKYYPIYVAKMEFIEKYFVEKFRREG